MRTPRAVLWLLLLVACAPATARSQATASRGATDAEYEVYSAVLENVYPESARTAYLVVDTTLGSIPFGIEGVDVILQRMPLIPEVTPELIRAYERANAHTAVLEEERFHTRTPVKIPGPEKLKQLREESTHRRSPGYADSVPARGDITFSRVGFSEDGRYAVLHVLTSCGRLCGEGRVLLLERRGGEWVLQASRRTIVA